MAAGLTLPLSVGRGTGVLMRGLGALAHGGGGPDGGAFWLELCKARNITKVSLKFL